MQHQQTWQNSLENGERTIHVGVICQSHISHAYFGDQTGQGFHTAKLMRQQVLWCELGSDLAHLNILQSTVGMIGWKEYGKSPFVNVRRSCYLYTERLSLYFAWYVLFQHSPAALFCKYTPGEWYCNSSLGLLASLQLHLSTWGLTGTFAPRSYPVELLHHVLEPIIFPSHACFSTFGLPSPWVRKAWWEKDKFTPLSGTHLCKTNAKSVFHLILKVHLI